MISKKLETNQVNLVADMAFCLERVPRPQKREWNPGRAQQTLELLVCRGQDIQSSQDRVLERRKLKETEPQRYAEGPFEKSVKSDQHMQVRKLPRAGRGPVKRIRSYSVQCSQRAENSVCFHQPAWRTSTFVGQRSEYTVGSPFSGKKNNQAYEEAGKYDHNRRNQLIEINSELTQMLEIVDKHI